MPTKTKTTVQQAGSEKTAALTEQDEIQVVSNLPNVSYKGDRSGDFYSWQNAGDIERMTFGELKDMWRSHKGYLRSMILKPLDERVAKEFRLDTIYKTAEKYFSASAYAPNRIDNTIREILTLDADLRGVVNGNIRRLISSGELTDIYAIRKIERELGLSLIGNL